MSMRDQVKSLKRSEVDRLEQEGKIKHLLKIYGFPSPGLPAMMPTICVASVLLMTAATLYVAHTSGLGGSDASDIAGSVFGVGAFLLAYQQWRAARYEASLDKYYDRLDVVNSRLEALPGVDSSAMYVFVELDSLEYVIEKYKLGYISSEHAFRGLKTFRLHCHDLELPRLDRSRMQFKDIATRLIKVGGYHRTTAIVLDIVCSEEQDTPRGTEVDDLMPKSNSAG